MSFISVSFLIFYLVVLLLRFTIGRDKQNNSYLNGLLLLSLIFYGWHVPEYLLIIIACILTNYIAGRLLSSLSLTQKVKRRVVMAAAICICIGLLAFFKYASFLVDTFRHFIGYGFPPLERFSTLDIVLPFGISFYTFQSLSYTIDVYRGHRPAERSLPRFALFISFFPQLVAGPIVRANQFFTKFPENAVCGGRFS